MNTLDPFTAINMACIAYLDESDTKGQKAQMEAALGQIPGNAGWTLAGGWGPALDDDMLAFVAVNAAKSAYAVGLRGTVGLFKPGFFTEWLKNLDVPQTDWNYPPNTGAKIANGTHADFQEVIAATDPDTHQTLLAYLSAELAKNPKATVMVAGHSLGGCLTTVVATYLYDQLNPRPAINPYTFAAPTAGNQQFVSLFSQMTGQRFVNQLDVAPKAFAGLVGGTGGPTPLVNMFPAPGPSFRALFPHEWEYLAFLAVAAVVQVNYAQTNPTPAASITSPGTVTFPGPSPIASNSFLAEAEVQHDHDLYFQYVASQTGHGGAKPPAGTASL